MKKGASMTMKGARATTPANTPKFLKVMKKKSISTIASIARRVLMKKKTISTITNMAKATSVNDSFASVKMQQEKTQNAKTSEPKVKVKSLLLTIKNKVKEQERAKAAALKKREQEKAEEMERRRRLSPEARQLEDMVAKNFPMVAQKIVEFDNAERLAKVQVEETNNAPRPSQCSHGVQENAVRDNAVEVGMQVFKNAWLEFVFERDRGHGNGEHREDRASCFQEKQIAEEYGELKTTLLNLLPWVGTLEACGNYHALERHGYKPPHHLEKGETHYNLLGALNTGKDFGLPNLEKLLGARIACLRSKPDFRAFEAFCAMLAAMSGRKEKNFLELFCTLNDIDAEVKKKPGCKTHTARRKEEVRKLIERESHYGFGFFAHFIVKTNASIRTAFAGGPLSPMPVSCMITQRMPFFDVVASEDGTNGDAPIQGAACKYSWCVQEGTEFAFQLANFAESDDHTNRKQREPAADLKPDPVLRALMLDRSKMCVHLDVICSLAPRDVAKADGHSEIVKAELEMLMRESKSRGEAVAFTLGSDRPHLLAEKVYMRKPIGNYGLRCGYIRWRLSSDHAWSRESPWEERACMMLQMP